MKTTDRANAALNFLVVYCSTNRGATAEVHRRLNARLSEPVTYRSVIRWLNPEAKKRTEPLLGVGLMLLDIAKDLTSAKGRGKAAR